MFKNKNKITFHSDLLENIIRDEIFSSERLEQYAYYLSSQLSISTGKKKAKSLLPRVSENDHFLKSAYQKLTKANLKGKDILPAGEWIIDNFHIIEDQIREIKEDLPENYYRELPKVKDNELAGYPRVYAIALAIIAHTDSHIDINTVKNFVQAFQLTTPLLIGEIWAIPIMIRIALIENLRRLSKQTVITLEIKDRIDTLSDFVLDKNNASDEKMDALINELNQILGRSSICDCAAISQLSQKLHARRPEILPACEHLDKYLAQNNMNLDEIIRMEHQLQAITQVSISNAVTSMRLLSNTDWQIFFEQLSLVDSILGQDPLGVYKKMEFESRDQYRHAVERLNKKTKFGEIEIAKEVLGLAQQAVKQNPQDKQTNHVGHYLIRKGVITLEKIIGYRPSIKEKCIRKILEYPTCFYLSFVILFILILLFPITYYAYAMTHLLRWPIIIGLLVIIPASDSCFNILNLFTTYFVDPYILPKINLEEGIPDEAKTFVVIPTIIENKICIAGLLEELEIRYISNQDKNLYFAILSDFHDAQAENLSSDNEILNLLKFGIKKLNNTYSTQKDYFYLFHRKRLWNPSENKWMGWERKRGKIHEFNRFLRGDDNTSFMIHPVFSTFFEEIKYVITLDTDTKLPRNSAKRLIGTIIHPLNQPELDKNKKIVTKGYSILQPRISITPESLGRTLFAKFNSGNSGLDPYTTAVSDVYQDLFGEGIYTGKGLYVVDFFEAALEKRAAENTLLSHDLFEGVFARTALISDIELFDEYPSQYESFIRRHHRWIRGDWQIIRWIFSNIPNHLNELVASPLSLISRWKIFDNLRRSLVMPINFIWFVLSWSILPGNPLIWTAVIISVFAFPTYVHTTSEVFKSPRNLSLIDRLHALWQDIKTNTLQLLIMIIVLPYQSYIHFDAIIRTLYRVFFSKNKLLRWSTAAKIESQLKNKFHFLISIFKYSGTISIIIFIIICIVNPSALYSASLFLALWIISPLILQKLGQINIPEIHQIDYSEKLLLRNIACKTWNFFETFVTEKHHWLPPDNFQEVPVSLVANRTSPTNMGLYLLSTCSAYDFGHIGPKELLSRLKQTLDSMSKLDRRFGHFYNWYNTLTLDPLEPKYISTVDSGNLAGHLITVKQTCIEIKKKDHHHIL